MQITAPIKVSWRLKYILRGSFTILIPILSVFLSFLVGAIVILWSGKNPLLAYSFLLQGAFGGEKEIATSLAKSIPLLFTGLGMTLAFRGGVWNIGGEGQLQLGAICAVIVGTMVSLPPVLHVTLAVLASAAGGLLWALLPAILKIKRNFNVVITTILFSYIGVLLTSYLIGGPLRQAGWGRQTDPVAETARLPILVPGTSLHAGILIGIACVIGVYILLSRTTVGYQIRAVGLNARAARAAGIKTNRITLLVFLVSGALAGLAGSAELLGYQYRLVEGFSPGYGWDGMAVSLLGNMNPFGTLLAAIFFGALRAGANTMQVGVGIPLSMNQLLQGLTVLFTLAGTVIHIYSKKGEASNGGS